MEKWKDIIGYEGLYRVSNLGRVKNRHNRLIKFKPIKSQKWPYLRVGLSKNNKQILYTVHRLVLMTFQPHDDQDFMSVDHINGDRLDNSLVNLRWLSLSENAILGQGWKRSCRFLSETEIEVFNPKTNETALYRLVK